MAEASRLGAAVTMFSLTMSVQESPTAEPRPIDVRLCPIA
jgi:hypothetical protein